MFSSKPKFDANKCKVQLKMLINRLNLLSSKKGNLAKSEKRKVAELLRETKEHNARILVEQIIRDDYLLEAYDLIKQYTEMLIARFNIITVEPELKPEIAASVCAIVYAGYLMGTEVDELKHLHILFTIKYGKPFTEDIIENKEKYINHRLLKILTQTEVPDPTVVDAYLEAIAQSYGVEYVPKAATSVQPISATLGIALPTPGQPMPGTAVPEPIDLTGCDSEPAPPPTAPSQPAPLLMGSEVPMAAGVVSGAMPTAMPTAIMPTVTIPTAVPTAVPTATPVAGGLPPGSAPSGSTTTTYRVQLCKVSAASKDGGHVITGLGLTLDAQDVVVGIAPADTPGIEAAALGSVRVGDKLLAINERQITGDYPVKSIAADIDLGAVVPLDLVRFAYGAPAMGGAGGAATLAAVPSATPVEQPFVEGGPVATPAVGPPPAAPPPAPPAASASAPEDSMEDLLKKRLDALKMNG